MYNFAFTKSSDLPGKKLEIGIVGAKLPQSLFPKLYLLRGDGKNAMNSLDIHGGFHAAVP